VFTHWRERGIGNAIQMSRSVLSLPSGNKRLRPTDGSASGVLGAGTEALLQLLSPLFGFHLMEAAEQRVQIATCQLAIGLPFHGTGF